jgi:hypothetical protein
MRRGQLLAAGSREVVGTAFGDGLVTNIVGFWASVVPALVFLRRGFRSPTEMPSPWLPVSDVAHDSRLL